MRKYENGFEIFFDEALKKKFYDTLNLIMRDVDYQLISSAIKKVEYLDKYGKIASDPYQIALTFVLERALFEAENTSDSFTIEAMIESRGKKEDAIIAQRYNSLLYRGSHKVTSGRFLLHYHKNIELRKKSNFEIGVELADLCAYPIARFVLNNDEPNQAFDIIRPKISCNNDGNIFGYGIKLFP